MMNNAEQVGDNRWEGETKLPRCRYVKSVGEVCVVVALASLTSVGWVVVVVYVVRNRNKGR